MKMRFHTLVIVLLFAAVAASLREMSAFLGDSVILKAGSDPTWRLTDITWSIYRNETWIATLSGGHVNIQRFYLFIGRLTLNVTTGDLTISNLNAGDALDYAVEVTNTDGASFTDRIRLKLKRHLVAPTIETLFQVSTHEGSWVGLSCSSPDQGAALSWNATAPDPDPHLNITTPAGSPHFVLASFATTAAVKFTCSSRRNTETASKSEFKIWQKPPRINVALLIAGTAIGFLGFLLLYFCIELNFNSRGSYKPGLQHGEQNATTPH